MCYRLNRYVRPLTPLLLGFNDPSLWAAQTTQERVSGVKACIRELSSGEEVNQASACDVDNMKEQKWSYAIPLEVRVWG